MYRELTKEEMERLMDPFIDSCRILARDAYYHGYRDAEEDIYKKADGIMKLHEAIKEIARGEEAVSEARE